MNENGSPIPQECDECGKSVAKIWRVFKGHRYCVTCYAREFKRVLCPECGNFARLPRGFPEAVCTKCEMNKPCVRCGKVSYNIGRITPYGPVCNACAPYFRKKVPCEVCGIPSSGLSQSKRLGHDRRVCPKCSRANHGTCGACRRYRLLREVPDGRMLCKKCVDMGKIPCPKCGRSMPAGYGQQCECCYWKGLLEKRVSMDMAAFSTPEMSRLFKAFGEWLGMEVGNQKAAITIHRYLPFFIEVEREWKTIPEYGLLLSHFGAARLRKVLLPMGWMTKTGLIVPDTGKKESDSEKRRIVVLLEGFPQGSKEMAILEGYHRSLQDSLQKGKTSRRSLRLALSPTVALLRKGIEMECSPPDQKVLDAFLVKSPGQRAAISGFIRYLREMCGVDIALPKMNSEKIRQNRMRKLEVEMLTLMQGNREDEEFQRKWRSVTLAYFHGLPKKVAAMLADDAVSEVDDGLIVEWKNHRYWLPKPGVKTNIQAQFASASTSGEIILDQKD